MYVPQVGDEVLYFRSGHQAYAEAAGADLGSRPPWDHFQVRNALAAPAMLGVHAEALRTIWNYRGPQASAAACCVVRIHPSCTQLAAACAGHLRLPLPAHL